MRIENTKLKLKMQSMLDKLADPTKNEAVSGSMHRKWELEHVCYAVKGAFKQIVAADCRRVEEDKGRVNFLHVLIKL